MHRLFHHPGAHNTIVTSRAGKDLVSSLVSGLLTIGPRFGGAIDDAARYFKNAYEKVGTLMMHLWYTHFHTDMDPAVYGKLSRG